MHGDIDSRTGDVVRSATHADIPAMVVMGEALFRRAKWPVGITYDPRSVAALLRTMIDGRDQHIGYHRYGFAGAVVMPAYFNHAVLIGTQLWWYNRPGHSEVRGPLLAAMEIWAAARGAAYFFTHATERMGGSAVGAFYKANGYTMAEHNYMKRL